MASNRIRRKQLHSWRSRTSTDISLKYSTLTITNHCCGHYSHRLNYIGLLMFFCYMCFWNLKTKQQVWNKWNPRLVTALCLILCVIIMDHTFIHPSLWPWPPLYCSILCCASSMPWQQIKLKSEWKKEALKCCHMQDCMGTSWGAHVVLGLLKRCWVCIVYRVELSMMDHSTIIMNTAIHDRA